MPPKYQLVWKIYFAVTLLFVAKKAYYLFDPNSESFYYYFILRAFNPFFYVIYTAHVLHIMLSIIHCLPLFFYIYRIRALDPEVWKSLFILRCIFELTGHSYEITQLTASSYSRPELLAIVVIIMVIPHIPSYLACYWYAFRQEKVFS